MNKQWKWLQNLVKLHSTVAIVNPLDFFAQSKNYTFLETLGYLDSLEICAQNFYRILYNLQARTKWRHKTAYYNYCHNRPCGTSIFHTLISVYKNYSLTKFQHDDVIFVYLTAQNRFSDFGL